MKIKTAAPVGRRKQFSVSAGAVPPIALLESLSESRISVLYLARQAKEAKNNALAKELTEKGQALRAEITRLRLTAHTEWGKGTEMFVARAAAAQAKLAQLVQGAEKSEKKLVNITRALSVVSNILALAKKVL